MIRGLFTGIAACALMSGAAFAQDRYYSPDHGYNSDERPYYGHAAYDRDDLNYRDDRRTIVHDHPDPGGHALRGGVAGAGLGAAIGCIVTIPIGCAPGAAIGAAVGGGTGAIAGAASTPSRDYYRHY